MSEKEKEEKEKKPKGPKPEGKGHGEKHGGGEKKAKKPKGPAPAEETADDGPQQPAPPARLYERFKGEIAPALGEKIGQKNRLAIPRLEKIVISMGVGRFATEGGDGKAKMQQAEQMGLTDPEGANNLWAEIDHEVTDQAPWVDLYNPKQIDFLSKRVHGYQWNPQWYILIDQQWLK